MLVPFVAALAVQTPTVYPKPMPPVLGIKLVGPKPTMKVRVVPNHKVKKHPAKRAVRPAVGPNPNA
jgi:hypothetical protein